MTDRPDTRRKIQSIAIALFIEQGYDKTSLREIAERLGVTKAALYYHFPTKDDIVNSLIVDRLQQVAQLIEWARTQPRTPQARREVIRRYAEQLYQPQAQEVVRFFERNQTAIKQMPAAGELREQLGQLIDLLSDPAAPLTVQLKSSLAIFAIHASLFGFRDRQVSAEQRREAALEVAYELIGDG